MAVNKMRPGALSTEDKEYITQNSSAMTVEEIAQILGRKPDTVIRFIEKARLPGFNSRPDDEQREIIRRKLEVKYWFPGLCRQLVDADERSFFVNKWVDFMLQFKEDVLASEEEQIKELILLSIALERIRIAEAENIITTGALQKKVEAEYKKDPMLRDPDLVNWEVKLTMAVAASQAYTKQIKEINHDLMNLNKDLKGTRDQRFKQIDSGNKTWQGLVRRMMDDDQRARISREAELMRIATDKKREELTSWHKYADGAMDVPILNSESIKKLRERDKQEEEENEEDQEEHS